MKTGRLIATPFLLLALSCSDVAQEDPANIVFVSAEDASMNAERSRARATFATFTAELAAPHPDTHYSVKVMFQDGDAVEHLWVNRLAYQDGVLTGLIDSEPVHVANVRLGQRVQVLDDNVSDWLILRDDRYRGGYTIRLFRDRMTPSERQKFDSKMGATPE